MRDIEILFTSKNKIFFVDESKRLQEYYDNTDGDNLYKELYGFLEEIDNWTSDQLSEMIMCGLGINEVDVYELWFNDSQRLFENHPQIFDYVEIDKCFGDLLSNGTSQSVLAFIKVLESLEAKEYNENYEYILQCHALARKLAKKETLEKDAIQATWRAEYEERITNQTRMLEQILSKDFEFIPRTETIIKKAS